MSIPCERQKQNAPGYGDPRAFALPREIGVTDLREGKSVDDGNRFIRSMHFTAQKQAGAAIITRQTCIGWIDE